MLNNRRMSALHRTDRTEVIMLKITALAENISENELLSADFGLSLYIEFGGKKILLDTASTGKCLGNAEKLGINLHSLDAIVLSHGHFDHTDGAVSLIENGITDTPVYISRYAFSERYWHRTDDGEFYFPTMAGISPAYLQRKHVPFRALCTDSYELGENIYILSNISRSCEFEAVCPNDFVKVGNDYVIDDYRDECVLVLDMGDGLAVLTGCGHHGIINIIRHVEKVFNKPVWVFVGGTHLVAFGAERTELTVKALKESNLKLLCAGHCTGPDAMKAFAEKLPFFKPLHTGTIIEL